MNRFVFVVESRMKSPSERLETIDNRNNNNISLFYDFKMEFEIKRVSIYFTITSESGADDIRVLYFTKTFNDDLLKIKMENMNKRRSENVI